MSRQRSGADRTGRPADPERESAPEKPDPGRLYRGESLNTRRRDQRERLLAAAREVFGTRGYAAASIDEIVALARVSRTSFYRFFSNKQECMLAVFEEEMVRLMETFARAAVEDDPEERIRLGVRAMVEGLASDPVTARVVMVEAVGASPELEATRLEARTRFARLLEGEMRRYPGWRDRPDAEIELTALATMAAVAESVGDFVARDRVGDWRDLVEPLTRFALRALTPE